MMLFREARLQDIPQMQVVRNSVQENKLSDPSVISDADYIPFLKDKGKGWICEKNDTVVGFAFIDVMNSNVWALFVNPSFENMRIGKTLHDLMLDWYFENYNKPLWLSTALNTRAEKFYELQGWTKAGLHGRNEIKFEMHSEYWKSKKG